MIWSPQQEKALGAVSAWMIVHDRPFFYLAGYAGTGKTTLAKHFAEGIDGEVVYGAFTGKAASVMRTKGCIDATTIHRLIYQSRSKGTAHLKELQAALRAESDSVKQYPIRIKIRVEIERLKQPAFALNTDSDIRDASLIIIDECSMVNTEMGEDLLSFDVPILVLGDPAQLPPVASSGFFTGRTPDIMLTEVHRHARESGILRLATEVREGKGLSYCDLGDANVITKSDLNPDEVPGYDQIIVGLNKTRHATNKRMREVLGRKSDYPEEGDRLVCLRNNHDRGLMNGEIWHAAGDACVINDGKLRMGIEAEAGAGASQTITAWQAPFRGEKLEHYERKGETQEFTYGYVLTAHKSQGSQWDSVIVFDESRFFRADWARWLYTSITRASKRLTVVR